jgi:AraC-like DNA-binding protein
MRAIIQKVPTFVDSSFAIQEYQSPHFSVPWHFHPEYELVLILNSEGKRFIGDSIKSFSPGDLVFIGSNIPHWYRNDAVYYDYSNNPTLKASSIFIQFTENFLGENFFSLPETFAIRKLLQKTQLGLEIKGEAKEIISQKMIEMPKLKGIDKLLALLSILNILSTSEEYSTISSFESVNVNSKDSERINTIYEYVMNNFKKPISIEEVSNKIYMCPSTFCRYFKKRTRKPFTYFLNEIRIGHACKMLIEKDLSIAEICFASGYNNISYFNRQFKFIKKTTPQLFKQEYREGEKKYRKKSLYNPA